MSTDVDQLQRITVGFLRDECEHLLSDIAALESGTLRLQHRAPDGTWIDTSGKRVEKLRRLLASRQRAIQARECELRFEGSAA